MLRRLNWKLGVWSVLLAAIVLILQGTAQEKLTDIPNATEKMVSALNSTQWSNLESGIDVIRAMTGNGTVLTAYRISPSDFSFSIVTQENSSGSRARDIGEREGAVLATNAGFFAESLSGSLYPIGYLRLNGDVLSKGWESDGGLISLDEKTLMLTPTHAGIPKNSKDVLQSRPMLIEPDGRWAMGSNLGEVKNRTVLCKQKDGNIVIALVTRVGMSLFEAGWIMREPAVGGFFDCDSAIALDGGRSTQVWYSGDENYSFPGLVPVHNFFVVRGRGN
ncbi:MAG: phosphodiester glycosidase family protein [Rhizobiaceae bacterium]|nr:phosphodiester glycosidase family protein [Rhizobiaceae bacterium]